MRLIKGYREFFDKAEDQHLKACKEEHGIFFIFRSIEAWKEERCHEKDIPEKELILDEFAKNRFIAHP